MAAQPRLVVVGSVNMDIVNTVSAYPRPGETVSALATKLTGGGKGANQAAAAAAAGGDVAFIGAVGADVFADELANGLASRGINTGGLLRKHGPTGQASIAVDAHGQNMIILSGGANTLVSAEDVAAARESITQASTLLTQNEIRWEATYAAMTLARAAGAHVIHNQAPAAALPSEAYQLIDTLVVNEIEAATLTGHPVTTLDSAEQAARELIGRGARAVIVTLGALGSLYLSADGRRVETPIFPVTVVDTTAAGDTFIGMYAVAATKMEVAQALRFATAASALCVSRPGAQESIPTRAEVEAFLREAEQGGSPATP